jgi:hypothetical protein
MPKSALGATGKKAKNQKKGKRKVTWNRQDHNLLFFHMADSDYLLDCKEVNCQIKSNRTIERTEHLRTYRTTGVRPPRFSHSLAQSDLSDQNTLKNSMNFEQSKTLPSTLITPSSKSLLGSRALIFGSRIPTIVDDGPASGSHRKGSTEVTSEPSEKRHKIDSVPLPTACLAPSGEVSIRPDAPVRATPQSPDRKNPSSEARPKQTVQKLSH